MHPPQVIGSPFVESGVRGQLASKARACALLDRRSLGVASALLLTRTLTAAVAVPAARRGAAAVAPSRWAAA